MWEWCATISNRARPDYVKMGRVLMGGSFMSNEIDIMMSSSGYGMNRSVRTVDAKYGVRPARDLRGHAAAESARPDGDINETNPPADEKQDG